MDARQNMAAEDVRQVEESRRLTNRLLKRQQDGSRYLVRKELGRGAMGVINLVYDQDLRRISAMKVIQPQLVDMAQRFYAFVTEAQLTAQLEHPNIVPIHELGINDDSGTPFYVMKLVEGEPLSDIIENLASENPDYISKYNPHTLLNIFRNVCHAIAYAHSRDVIHRDIKPENIMIGHFGEVLVMDWGLAKKTDAEEEEHDSRGDFINEQFGSTADMTRTQDGMIKGSPAYMSPEQAYGDVDSVDHRTDIFLLGSTLYHMFTHHPPYEGPDVMDLVDQAEKCNFISPSKRNPKHPIPMALERIILKAMAPMSENRYQWVEEMLEDLDAFITGRRVSGRRVFAPGESLIVAGEQTSECYVIVSGKVEVFQCNNGEKDILTTAGPGDIIGEMAGITQTLSSASVMALETTDTLVIKHELITEELQKLPPWLEHIIVSLTNRVKNSLQRLEAPLDAIRLCSVICQLYHLLLAIRELKKLQERVSTKRSAVVQELNQLANVPAAEVEKIVDILAHAELIQINSHNEIAVGDLRDIKLFADYCRGKFEIEGGVKSVAEMRLTSEKEHYFRRISNKLMQLLPESK